MWSYIFASMNEEFLAQKLAKRLLEGNLRKLSMDNRGVDFSSNDYLGLAKNEDLQKTISARISSESASSGSTGSRLLTGNSALHEEIENTLSDFFDSDSALLFPSGYTANLALLSTIPQRGDTILYDDYSHASIKDGVRLSNAQYRRFNHNDFEDLDQKIASSKGRVFVVVESVYSMDGDICDFERILKVIYDRQAYLIVDEAHSTGIYGQSGNGLINDLGLQSQVYARIFTFGKALGLHGACVTGSTVLRDFLINFARPFIYSTAPPPSHLISIQETIQYLNENRDGKVKLFENITKFQELIKQLPSGIQSRFLLNNGPIQGIVVGDNSRCRELSEDLSIQGYLQMPILSPTVPQGSERIRICLHSFNTFSEIEEFVQISANILS